MGPILLFDPILLCGWDQVQGFDGRLNGGKPITMQDIAERPTTSRKPSYHTGGLSKLISPLNQSVDQNHYLFYFFLSAP